MKKIFIVFLIFIVSTVLMFSQATSGKVTEHAFFNMIKTKESVDEQMDKIRGGRFNDI